MARAKTAAERRAQNRGVKAGTVRMGAAGKGLRRYNPKTGRWDKFSYGSRTGAKARVPGAGKDGVNPTSSDGPAKTSSSYNYEGPRRSQAVTRIGSTVKLGPSNFVKPVRRTPNRPTRGVPMRAQTEKSGRQRWVQYVKPKGKR